MPPELVGIPLAELSTDDVTAMFTRTSRRSAAAARALSPATLTRIRATLRTGLNGARRAGHVTRNPARDVELPRVTRPHPLV